VYPVKQCLVENDSDSYSSAGVALLLTFT